MLRIQSSLLEFLIIAIVSFISTSAFGNGCDLESVNKNLFQEHPHVIFSGPFSVDELEKISIVTIELDGKKKELPFGFQNNQWMMMKSMVMNGDCLFYFDSNGDQANVLFEITGYILIRDGRVISHIISSIS